MAKVLIIYDSRDGVVYTQAKAVAEGIRSCGVDAILEDITAAVPNDLVQYDGIVIGSPCHLAGVSGAIKSFLDTTWSLRGKLDGKVGAGFAAERHMAGGAEQTLRSIHDAMLVHGMTIIGGGDGAPFGAVALVPDDDKTETLSEDNSAATLGGRVAELVKKLV